MSIPHEPTAARRIAYVGSYAVPGDSDSGGITAVAVSPDGAQLEVLSHTSRPQEAGYLVYSSPTGTLYAVDERKTDGRGPVNAPSAVHALSAAGDGTLTWLGSLPVPAPFPTYLDLDADAGVLVAASHGSFDHVERVIRTTDGGWDVEFVYDDSAVLLYELGPDGSLTALRDLHLMNGHGLDPNASLQAGGHGQSSGHAHCAVFDPSRRFVLVADKGTDEIHVYRVADFRLELASSYQFPSETGPRHIVFDTHGVAYVTLEFASALASMSFDDKTGHVALLHQVSTLAAPRFNEPADLHVHPDGRFVYVNNRGEDSLAWFAIGDGGTLDRRGHVRLALSVHPGLAARSFTLDPTGTFVLVADRPADLVRSYRVDLGSGALTPLTEISISQPAFIALVEEEFRP